MHVRFGIEDFSKLWLEYGWILTTASFALLVLYKSNNGPHRKAKNGKSDSNVSIDSKSGPPLSHSFKKLDQVLKRPPLGYSHGPHRRSKAKPSSSFPRAQAQSCFSEAEDRLARLKSRLLLRDKNHKRYQDTDVDQVARTLSKRKALHKLEKQ